MRATVLLVLLAPLLARADAPPIDQLRSAAAQVGKPLVVEISATWCEPCRAFERSTLPDPRVKKALDAVFYARYDADETNGSAVVDRYGVRAYPTFLVIDRAGVERARFTGSMDAQRFVAKLEQTAPLVRDESTVRAHVRAKPADPIVLREAARWYAAHDRREEAIKQLAAVLALATATPEQRAEAQREHDRLSRLLAWRSQLVTEKVALIRRAPASATTDDIAIAVLGGTLPDADRRALLGVLAASQTEPMALSAIVLVALAAGDLDEALGPAMKAVAMSRDFRTLRELAEVRHAAGQKTEALLLVDEALALAKGTEYESQLAANKARYASSRDESPMVTQMRTSAAHVWTRLETLDSLDVPSGVGRARGFDRDPSTERYVGLARALRKLQTNIATACRARAGTTKDAFARVEITASGAVGGVVWLLERSAPVMLEPCLDRALGRPTLPSIGVATSVTLHIELGP